MVLGQFGFVAFAANAINRETRVCKRPEQLSTHIHF